MQHGRTDPVDLASSAQRLIAWALDALVLGLLTPLLWWLRPTPDVGSVVAFSAVVVFVGLVYFAAFDGGRRGATLGKRLLGIRVVDRDGHSPIGYKRAVLRRVGYVLGYLVVLVGWLWIFVDGRHRAWHDVLAGTLVVRTR